MKAPKNLLLEMLKKMLEIRYFERKWSISMPGARCWACSPLYRRRGSGGRCLHELTDEDYITSTHRGHGIASPKEAN